MKLLSIALALSCFASLANAQTSKPENIDAPAWLDGCAVLSRGHTFVQMHMDTKCFEWGVTHCWYSPSLQTRLDCRNDFVRHLDLRFRDLLADLPSEITTENHAEALNYQTALSKLTKKMGTSACTPRGENGDILTRCHVGEAGLRWVEARRLARWAGLKTPKDSKQ